ncbi:MAG: sel1 repeat family protein, partial [Lentisphaeria bacterium]|nr:sel1 repeat family protein [Lentisphaeria bacterium]
GKGFDYAMEFYEKSMAQECPQALHRVALFALKGIGMEKPDKVKAAMLLERAAVVGYPTSQYSLGCMYAEGDGIPQDDTRSFLWFSEAAKRGHAAAMRRLALCYYQGMGCTKDNGKAVMWLNYAAQAGDYTAIQMLEKNRRF